MLVHNKNMQNIVFICICFSIVILIINVLYIYNTRLLLKNNFNYHSDRLAIDNILPLLNSRGFKTLTTIPMLVHHAVGFESTLQPKGPVNYDIWINGSWDKHYYNIIKHKKVITNDQIFSPDLRRVAFTMSEGICIIET